MRQDVLVTWDTPVQTGAFAMLQYVIAGLHFGMMLILCQ